MKKIIALALALIMALSMASVAFAAPVAPTFDAEIGTAADGRSIYAPGSKIALATADKDTYKVYADFNSKANTGAAMVKEVSIDRWDNVVLELKESYNMTDAKTLKGVITVENKKNAADKTEYPIDIVVNNKAVTVFGEKKAAKAADTVIGAANTVYVCDEDYAGYVKVAADTLLNGVVKMEAKEKAYLEVKVNDADVLEALEAYVGEDTFEDAILDVYTMVGTGFKADVAWELEAWNEDDHYAIYAWDGEALTKVEAKLDTEDLVYEFDGAANTTYVVSDVELVAATEETKNPDTGANDVVGVAAALAVVSLVAAGAVSLKK